MLQVLCIAISTACLIAPAFGQSFLVSMGQLPDLYPTGTVLSADGSTVFANFQGNDVQEAYRWRLGEGFTPVPRLTNYRGSAVGASSADGSRFCGLVQDSPSPINTSPAVWRNGMNGPPELNRTVFYSLRAM